VHVGGDYGSTCAEDYLARILDKYIPQVKDASEDQKTEEMIAKK